MININRCSPKFVAICALVGIIGCTTNDEKVCAQASSVAVAATESVAVSVSSESTSTVLHSTEETSSHAPITDIIKDVRKPCSAVAADATKFVNPEEK